MFCNTFKVGGLKMSIQKFIKDYLPDIKFEPPIFFWLVDY